MKNRLYYMIVMSMVWLKFGCRISGMMVVGRSRNVINVFGMFLCCVFLENV